MQQRLWSVGPRNIWIVDGYSFIVVQFDIVSYIAYNETAGLKQNIVVLSQGLENGLVPGGFVFELRFF
jgi:hypothetical protein